MHILRHGVGGTCGTAPTFALALCSGGDGIERAVDLVDVCYPNDAHAPDALGRGSSGIAAASVAGGAGPPTPLPHRQHGGVDVRG